MPADQTVSDDHDAYGRQEASDLAQPGFAALNGAYSPVEAAVRDAVGSVRITPLVFLRLS
jgi:hypothetical protein